MNPLKQLQQCGQAPWLDFVSRSLIESGQLQQLIERDGLKGMTSNPALFEKAIAETDEYTHDLQDFLAAEDHPATAIYEHLAIAEIRRGADALLPVFETSNGVDGYISLEVSPYLAHDTAATVAEARRLWQALARPNVMVKVPATPAGIAAIRQLIADGININVTLLFALDAYAEVAEAYLVGLEQRLQAGGDIAASASVASFFISRIDTEVGRRIDAAIAAQPGARAALDALRDKAAIANAKLAYAHFRSVFAGPRWQRLAARGARPQRLLWASTSTKNPALRDTLYVEQLIGPDTVNTMPPATMAAFREHGRVEPGAVAAGLDAARDTLAALARHGILMPDVGRQLVDDGVQLFATAFDRLLGTVAQRRASLRGIGAAALNAAPVQQQAVAAELERWRTAGNIRRLWRGDSGLWTDTGEDQWLGWLDAVQRELADSAVLNAFALWVRVKKFTDVCLIGMGGSSLGPEVLDAVWPARPGWPRFHIVDSTDPQQIGTVEAALNLASTLFIVASKSGSTLEPDILKRYFFERVGRLGKEITSHPGAQFVAITDPGSALAQEATADGFAHIFYGVPSIGGRYSVLSKFGLIPAAAIGIDVENLLRSSRAMVLACAADVPPAQNPGVQLGAVLGVLARDYRRDKVTVLAPPALAPLAAWLEQLLAESTGKQGRGLIPIADEAAGAVSTYGDDRVFIHIAGVDGADPAQDAAVAALAAAGQPVVRIAVADVHAIGQEFFRWEIATAVAGAIIGINPFDQPDVEASKIETRALTAAFERDGALPQTTALIEEGGIALFTDATNAAALGRHATVAAYLQAHLARVGTGDYLALLAFIERNAAHSDWLHEVRTRLRTALHVATCGGFGPRFLHSTGQAYKGGPNSGVFIQITCADNHDLAVPGHRYSFGVVNAAQAQGDFSVLTARGRRALRVHLQQLDTGLPQLAAALYQAIS